MNGKASIGNFLFDHTEFLPLYRRYEPFLSQKSKDLCSLSVYGEEYGSWYVQSGFYLSHDIGGYGETFLEAAEDFLKKLSRAVSTV